MGFIKSLFADRIRNENKSKPFYENKNPLERKDWFSRTRPWNQIHSEIIDALINKFGEDQMFEVFVVTSMKLNLLNQYIDLNPNIFSNDPALICCTISVILCEIGSASLKQMVPLINEFKANTDKLRYHYGIVMDTLKSAIILDRNQVSAYIGLAVAKGLIFKFEDALRYARQGRNIIKEMENQLVPFPLSDIDEIKNANQSLDACETHLNQLIDDFEKQLT